MKKAFIILSLLLVLCCLGVYADVPVANAGNDQTVFEDYVVTLNGSASYQDVTYTWAQTDGPTVSLSSTIIANPYFTPSVPGTYQFGLVVANASDTTQNSSDTVTVTVEQIWKIKSLDVKVGSKTEKNLQDKPVDYRIRQEAKPQDTIKFDVEVESLLKRNIPEQEFDIQDILITVTISDIDDGEDLEEESDEFDVRPEKKHSETLQFEVPLKVDEGDYDVTIQIDGNDENSVEHIIEKNLILVVQKDRHYIFINKLNLNPSTVKCSRTATLTAEIMNLGRDDEEDVSLDIMSQELGINSVSSPDYYLSYNWDDDENTYEKVLTLTFPQDFKAGTYPIVAKSYYDSRLSETKTVELVVEECKPVVAPPAEEEEKEAVVEITEPEIPEDIVPAEPIEEEEVPFMQSSQFYTLLVIVIVLVVGLIIFLVGALVIKSSKKRG